MGASRKLDESSQHQKLPRPPQGAPVESDKDAGGTLGLNTSESAMPGDGLSTQEDWRELAQRVQQEKDPNKMIELVQQLIARFDDDHLRKGSRGPSQADSRPPLQSK
jgi:hypothetical protein